MNTIYPYQTQEVRDLAWACFFPTLLRAQQLADDGQNVADCELTLTPARLSWLEQLDRNAGALLDYLADMRSHRLGIYFERLWHFFLEQDPDVDLVAHNLAIREQGQTIGEFDCIYYCHQRQRHVHLELAVKYFLSHRQTTALESRSHWQEWLGPNTRDRLDLKIEHLMQRQIQLGDNPVASEHLYDLNIRDLAKEVVIKGYLFQSHSDPLPAPHGFNEDCKLAQWLDISALEAYLQDLDCRAFLILPRLKWLSTACANPATTPLTSGQLLAELQVHFRDTERPQLVAALHDSGWERQRFFVTASGWPFV